MSKSGLLPCPFCGSEDVDFCEVGTKQEQIKRDKLGRISKRISIYHAVQCGYCGASGGSSWLNHSDEEVLTAAIINASKESAALLWNARQPLNDDAFKLVNKLILSAFSKST